MSDPAIDLAYKIGIAQGKSDELARDMKELLDASRETQKRDDNGQELRNSVWQNEGANDSAST